MIKICFDAGHGIGTAGKRSPDETFREYKFNRELTKKMIKLLESYKDEIETCVTQDLDNNYDLSLGKRCEVANKLKADYFISIHANAFYFSDNDGKYIEEYNSVKGWEVYVLSKGGKAEQLAKQVRYSVLNNIPKIVDRGIRVANFAVLRGTNMPAILIEAGFYTNLEEKNLLASDEYKDILATSYVEGILNYLQIPINVPDVNVVIEKEPRYKVQAGAYSIKENAENMVEKLKQLGIESYIIKS